MIVSVWSIVWAAVALRKSYSEKERSSVDPALVKHEQSRKKMARQIWNALCKVVPPLAEIVAIYLILRFRMIGYLRLKPDDAIIRWKLSKAAIAGFAIGVPMLIALRYFNNPEASAAFAHLKRCLSVRRKKKGELKVAQKGDSTTQTIPEDGSRKLRGLQNLGNTCYFNSTMQAIAHTYVFQEALKNLAEKGEFVTTMLEFYNAMNSVDEANFAPNLLHDLFGKLSPRFADRRQHDSHECLRHLLDNIRKEERARAGGSRKILTTVDKVFGGQFVTVYICLECKSPYFLFEPLLDISLPISIDAADLEEMDVPGRTKTRNVKIQTIKHQVQRNTVDVQTELPEIISFSAEFEKIGNELVTRKDPDVEHNTQSGSLLGVVDNKYQAKSLESKQTPNEPTQGYAKSADSIDKLIQTVENSMKDDEKKRIEEEEGQTGQYRSDVNENSVDDEETSQDFTPGHLKIKDTLNTCHKHQNKEVAVSISEKDSSKKSEDLLNAGEDQQNDTKRKRPSEKPKDPLGETRGNLYTSQENELLDDSSRLAKITSDKAAQNETQGKLDISLSFPLDLIELKQTAGQAENTDETSTGNFLNATKVETNANATLANNDIAGASWNGREDQRPEELVIYLDGEGNKHVKVKQVTEPCDGAECDDKNGGGESEDLRKRTRYEEEREVYRGKLEEDQKKENETQEEARQEEMEKEDYEADWDEEQETNEEDDEEEENKEDGKESYDKEEEEQEGRKIGDEEDDEKEESASDWETVSSEEDIEDGEKEEHDEEEEEEDNVTESHQNTEREMSNNERKENEEVHEKQTKLFELNVSTPEKEDQLVEIEEESIEYLPNQFDTPGPCNSDIDVIRLLITPLSNHRKASSPSEARSRGTVTIDDCLRHFTRLDHIENEYLCNPCYNNHVQNGGEDILLTSATKQTLIFSPPAILTLHLKRFELKPGKSVKRSDMVTYGEFLDIAPYCSSQCLRNYPPSQNIWYSLYAVVVHTGTLEFGHYFAYVKLRENDSGIMKLLQETFFDNDVSVDKVREMMKTREAQKPSTGNWYCINDSYFHPVTIEEVLNQEAYLLFYERLC